MKNDLKAVLAKSLTAEEMKYAPNSYEIIGSDDKAVAIVEIPEEMRGRKTLIAGSIMQLSKNVKTVLEKSSARKGDFRTREYELVMGDPDTEVEHKENGYRLKLNPQKVYFSEREGTERTRVARQVERGENVMVFFAGIGAYAIAIVHEQPDVGKVYAIEINPEAVEYMKSNLRANRMADKIVPIFGDVKEEARRFYGKFDRIVMPLPLGASEFLEDAVLCLKKKGIIHFYTLTNRNDFAPAIAKVEEACSRLKKRFKVLNQRKITEYSPKEWKVCIDFEVE